jgi:hypothetical protein
MGLTGRSTSSVSRKRSIPTTDGPCAGELGHRALQELEDRLLDAGTEAGRGADQRGQLARRGVEARRTGPAPRTARRCAPPARPPARSRCEDAVVAERFDLEAGEAARAVGVAADLRRPTPVIASSRVASEREPSATRRARIG